MPTNPIRLRRVSLTMAAAGLTFALSLAGDAEACRFNVRDTAFVDLGDRPYGLVWSGDENTNGAPSGEQLAALQADFRRSNVCVKAERLRAPSPSGWSLLAPDGRRLPIDGSPVDSDPLEPNTALAERCLDAHTVVLLFESDDNSANEAASQLIDETISRVVASSALWPKAINDPPVVEVVARDELSEKRLLVWSLAIDERLRSAPSEPLVVVLFGRGRLLGQPLAASELKGGKLDRLLAVVSMDCECEYDIAPLIGRMIPHRWSKKTEERAAEKLGFDPGHPLTKTEVGNILSRRPKSEDGAASPLLLDDPLMGYQEIILPSPRPASGSQSDALETTDPSSQPGANSSQATAHAAGAGDGEAVELSDAEAAKPGRLWDALIGAPVGLAAGAVVLAAIVGSILVIATRQSE